VFQRFFDPDRGVWPWISAGVDLVGLSLLWLFCCLPVVTIGPATAALYLAVVKYVRPREAGAFACFFRSFRENLKQGCAVSALCALAVAILTAGYLIMRQNRNTPTGYVLYAAYYWALTVPAGVLCWLFPLLGRFGCTVKQLFGNALTLALRHLPTTVVLVLLVAESAVWSIRTLFPLFFMPGTAALLASLFLERVFAKEGLPPAVEPEP
jgi:uncharacterized membrane protein YesL